MGQVGCVLLLALVFGPLALCVYGFIYHPLAGVAAVVNLLVIIGLLGSKKEGPAGCLWILSGILTLIVGISYHL